MNIGVLASTKATDLQAVIDGIETKKLNVKISVVISNKEDAYALERARKHDIDAVFVDSNGKQFFIEFKGVQNKDKEQQREQIDRYIANVLDNHNVDLILLIGYLRILSSWFVNKYKNKIINIHPSLLPAFAGGMDKDVHAEVLKVGVKETGCTLHFVTKDVDSGPIIFQKKVKVEENENVDSLKEKVQKVEQEVIVKALKLFEEGKIKVEDGKVKILE